MANGQLTLLQIRDLCKKESDFENSGFISDSEWNSYINQSYYELYDLLVQKYGNDYFVKAPHSFVTDGVSFLFPLPSDFYKELGLDLALSNTNDSFVTLHRFNFADRNRYAVPNFQSFYGVTNMRYRLNGNNIWITPIPAANQTLRLWYVPRLTELVNDSDIADGVSGWLEYVIVDAAIKAKDKEEDDISVLMNRKMGLIQRIESAAENRDAANPMTVADNQIGSQGWWPAGSGTGFGGSF